MRRELIAIGISFIICITPVFTQEPLRLSKGESKLDAKLDFKTIPVKNEIANNWEGTLPSFCIDNAEDMVKFWKFLNGDEKLPKIDFEKETAVFVLANASRFKISKNQRGEMWLDFALGKWNGKGPRPYALAIFDKKLVDEVLKTKKK